METWPLIFSRGDLCDITTKNQVFMWTLRMKPMPKEPWETMFDRKDILFAKIASSIMECGSVHKRKDLKMKDFVKGIISYAILIGIPIFAIGAASAGAYKQGYEDGRGERNRYTISIQKQFLEETETTEE